MLGPAQTVLRSGGGVRRVRPADDRHAADVLRHGHLLRAQLRRHPDEQRRELGSRRYLPRGSSGDSPLGGAQRPVTRCCTGPWRSPCQRDLSLAIEGGTPVKATVLAHLPAAQAKFGRGKFDSWLLRGKVKDLKNAELVLDLRINL